MLRGLPPVHNPVLLLPLSRCVGVQRVDVPDPAGALPRPQRADLRPPGGARRRGRRGESGLRLPAEVALEPGELVLGVAVEVEGEEVVRRLGLDLQQAVVVQLDPAESENK